MFTIWFTTGVVQDYPDRESAEAELAEVMELDDYPFAHIRGPDGREYRHRVRVTLEPKE